MAVGCCLLFVVCGLVIVVVVFLFGSLLVARCALRVDCCMVFLLLWFEG